MISKTFPFRFPQFVCGNLSLDETNFLSEIIGFDREFYLRTYGDVAEAGVDPFWHFLEYGLEEGRLPCDLGGDVLQSGLLGRIGFDAGYYTQRYQDVPSGEGIAHFVENGMSEQRLAYDLRLNEQDEIYSFKFLARIDIKAKISLEEQITKNIEIADSALHNFYDTGKLRGGVPRTFRNNFWMVVAILALSRGWLAVAKAAYNFFFNYYLPMARLKNGDGMVIETARMHKSVDYARSIGATLVPLESARRTLVPTPVFLNRPVDPRPDEWHDLPEPHYMRLNNVMVMGETALIRVGTHDYIYDYLEPAGERSAEIKTQMIMHNINGFCAVRSRPVLGYVAEAFSLLHDHSHNYFHWLLEVLPRLLLARDQGLVGDVPLLVQERLAPQMEEILTLVLGAPPTLIKVGPGYNMEVGTLHHVTDICHNEVHTLQVASRRDILLSPTAIALLRQVAAPVIRSGVKAMEKVLITRRNVSFRRLVNRDGLERMLKNDGYYVFDPGEVDFVRQVQVFSNARLIVCEAGAAQANMVFCQPGATVCVLVNGCSFSNYYYLMEFGHLLGLRVRLVECLRLEGTHELGVQDDMIVHLGELAHFLREIEMSLDAVVPEGRSESPSAAQHAA